MTSILPAMAELRRVMGDGSAATLGAPELRVAVVTPYCGESEEVLGECHRSVLAQTHRCTHVLVADGEPAAFVRDWDAQHIALPVRHGDSGDTPRAIGGLSAAAQGFDAIAFLDADNWFAPEHIATMIELHVQAAATVCVASRSLHRLDGSLLRASGEPGDGIDHVDTNCLFLTAAAYRVLPMWSLLPRQLHLIGDRIVWSVLRALNYRVARSSRPTVAYRTAFRVHYEEQGEVPPPGAKDHARVVEARRFWARLSGAERELVFRRLGVAF